MKILFVLLISVFILFAQGEKKPVGKFVSSGGVVDMVYDGKMLYSATSAGVVDIFDYKTKKNVKKIQLDKIKDFLGDKVESKVFSVDVLNQKILILSQDDDGFRRVHVYQNGKLTPVITAAKKLTISKAKFLDENTILLGLLSNELVSYNISGAKFNWITQISGAKFSDFALNETKSEVVIADESGSMKIHSTKNGKLLKNLSSGNLDNVFQVDYKSGVIATGGQDRKMIVYNQKTNSSYYVKTNFLVYGVGLSPSGAFVCYASDESNNVSVLNTATKANLGSFGGIKMTLSKIIFINEKEFLVASDDKIINQYSLK